MVRDAPEAQVEDGGALARAAPASSSQGTHRGEERLCLAHAHNERERPPEEGAAGTRHTAREDGSHILHAARELESCGLQRGRRRKRRDWRGRGCGRCVVSARAQGGGDRRRRRRGGARVVGRHEECDRSRAAARPPNPAQAARRSPGERGNGGAGLCRLDEGEEGPRDDPVRVGRQERDGLRLLGHLLLLLLRLLGLAVLLLLCIQGQEAGIRRGGGAARGALQPGDEGV